MDLAEFEERFESYWKKSCSQYDDEGKDHQTLLRDWKKRADDSSRRTGLKMKLLQYIRDCQSIGISRRAKNLSQRILNEMGVDPHEVELRP